MGRAGVKITVDIGKYADILKQRKGSPSQIFLKVCISNQSLVENLKYGDQRNSAQGTVYLNE